MVSLQIRIWLQQASCKSYLQDKTPVVIGRDNLLISELLGFPTIDHHLEACGEMAFQLFLTEKKDKSENTLYVYSTMNIFKVG